MSPKFHSCQKVQTRRDKCHPGIWNPTVMFDLGEPGDCVDAESRPRGTASPVPPVAGTYEAPPGEQPLQVVQYPPTRLRDRPAIH